MTRMRPFPVTMALALASAVPALAHGGGAPAYRCADGMTTSANPLNRSRQAGEVDGILGPFLYLRGLSGVQVMVTALVVRAALQQAPEFRTDRGGVPAKTIWE
tara:strand:- start:681 stop:989 length:309 start_codon:yes stop_codon:yes gene_type:complete